MSVCRRTLTISESFICKYVGNITIILGSGAEPGVLGMRGRVISPLTKNGANWSGAKSHSPARER